MAEYTYQLNGRDGTFDLIELLNPKGEVIITLYYWGDDAVPCHPQSEQARVEKAARTICELANHWHINPDTREV